MTVYAESIMTRTVVSAGPDDTVSAVAALFSKHGISGVPVCDKDGTLLGIISEGDLMRPFGEANKLRRDWWLGLLADGEELAPEFVEYMRLDRRRARDLMTKEVVTATEDTPVDRIADLSAEPPHQARADRQGWQGCGCCQPRRCDSRHGALAG